MAEIFSVATHPVRLSILRGAAPKLGSRIRTSESRMVSPLVEPAAQVTSVTIDSLHEEVITESQLTSESLTPTSGNSSRLFEEKKIKEAWPEINTSNNTSLNNSNNTSTDNASPNTVGDGKPRRSGPFPFLRRSSKNFAPIKLDWKNVTLGALFRIN